MRYVNLDELERFYTHTLHHRTKGQNINGDFFTWLKQRHPEITLNNAHEKVVRTYFKKPSRGIALLNRPTFDTAEKDFITRLLAEYGIRGHRKGNGRNHK